MFGSKRGGFFHVHAGRVEDGLYHYTRISKLIFESFERSQMNSEPSYLVRKGQGELDLVRDRLSVTSALERHAVEDGGASPEGRASKTERAHLVMDGGWGGLGGGISLLKSE